MDGSGDVWARCLGLSTQDCTMWLMLIVLCTLCFVFFTTTHVSMYSCNYTLYDVRFIYVGYNKIPFSPYASKREKISAHLQRLTRFSPPLPCPYLNLFEPR